MELTQGVNGVQPAEPAAANSSDGEPAKPPLAAAAPHKVFSCNFCMRNFFSSQALGGRAPERAQAIVVVQPLRAPPEDGDGRPAHHQRFVRALRVNPSSSAIHKPITQEATAARFHDGVIGPWPPLVFEEVLSSTSWPGSFRLRTQPEPPSSEQQEQPSEQNKKIDLSLRL